MRISLMLEGQEGIEWEQWLELALAAEAAGLEGLFRSDHYRAIVRSAPAGALDAWATLAALAAPMPAGYWRSKSHSCSAAITMSFPNPRMPPIPPPG
jgi:hypothetical protein